MASGVTGKKLVAVSYSRVSTGKQSAEDRSGLERQEQAIAAWLRAHPDYELDREIRHVGSGAKAGRFEWFVEELQQGRLPRGTCLVVEKISRFSREPVTDVLETLIRLFRAGGTIAACELGGEVLADLNGQNGAVFMLVGAIQRARGEWEERRDRKLGSDRKKRREIAEGAKPFRSRQKGTLKAMYPFWLDFDEKEGRFRLNDQADWVKRAFLWAQEVGSTTIARRLKADGIRCPTDRRKAIAATRIVNLLKDRAVLGERQHVDAKGQPAGEPVPGVYPPVVTEEEWLIARQAVGKRHSGHTSTGAKRHNLFEGRIFCPHCCGRIGLYRSRVTLADGTAKHYGYLRCMTHQKDPEACPATRRPYDEDRLLTSLQDFRWAQYFSDAKHEAELAKARERVLAAEGVVAEHQQATQRIQQAQDEFIREGRAWPPRLDDELSSAEADLRDAEADRNVARGALEALQRRTRGKDAQRAIQKRVAAFLASDREDLNTRHDFNRWLYKEGLVISYDLIEDTLNLGAGELGSYGLLEVLDTALEDAAALGVSLGPLIERKTR
jgi:DNA invertase Pin-like site-specific DNA recombinase